MTLHAGRVVARLLLSAAMLGGMGWEAGAQMAVPGGTGVTGMQSPAVFGGARRQAPGSKSLSAAVSAFGGYDTNILADDGAAGGSGGGTPGQGSTSQTASTFVGTSATLQWSQQRRRVSYFGGVNAGYRSFFDVDDFDTTSYGANFGASGQLSARSSVSAAADVDVQPFYQLGVLNAMGAGLQPPGTGLVFTPDYQAARSQALRYSAQAGYLYRLSEKTSFSIDGGRNGFLPLNAGPGTAALTNLGSTYAAARFIRRLTTNLGARLGYGYSHFDKVDTAPLLPGDVVQQQQSGLHNIDVGLDYARELTFSRRTTFSFGTGTNIGRSTTESVEGRGNNTQFNVSGFASLQRQFLRTWAASLNYNRGTSYLEGVNSFGVFDTATVSIGGLFSNRLDGSAGVTYTHGALGNLTGDKLSNMAAGAQLRYGFTEYLAMFVSYTYALSDVPESQLPQDLRSVYQPDRQGVRVGVSIWTDLLR